MRVRGEEDEVGGRGEAKEQETRKRRMRKAQQKLGDDDIIYIYIYIYPYHLGLMFMFASIGVSPLEPRLLFFFSPWLSLTLFLSLSSLLLFLSLSLSPSNTHTHSLTPLSPSCTRTHTHHHLVFFGLSPSTAHHLPALALNPKANQWIGEGFDGKLKAPLASQLNILKNQGRLERDRVSAALQRRGVEAGAKTGESDAGPVPSSSSGASGGATAGFAMGDGALQDRLGAQDSALAGGSSSSGSATSRSGAAPWQRTSSRESLRAMLHSGASAAEGSRQQGPAASFALGTPAEPDADPNSTAEQLRPLYNSLHVEAPELLTQVRVGTSESEKREKGREGGRRREQEKDGKRKRESGGLREKKGKATTNGVECESCVRKREPVSCSAFRHVKLFRLTRRERSK